MTAVLREVEQHPQKGAASIQTLALAVGRPDAALCIAIGAK